LAGKEAHRPPLMRDSDRLPRGVTPVTDGTGTLEITTSHMPGSVAQEAVNPIIEIDGQPQQGKWGANVFSVSPGHHSVKAYHKWLVFKEAYASSTTVDVAEGQTVRLEWHTGAAAFRPAKWSVL
jgi:hypothetical protein